MLQALSPARPVAKNIMTLGPLDRKAADPRSPSSTSNYSHVQAKVTSSAPSTSTSAKPKTLLSCKCAELKVSGLTVLHSVQLLLTSYSEVLVLKRGDKSRHQTVLRRHSAITDEFKEHPILPSALLVEVPNTMLRYVYQFDKEKTLRQLLDKVASCRREAGEFEISMKDYPIKNGLIANSSAAYAEVNPSRPAITSSPSINAELSEPPKVSNRGCSPASSSTYSQGPASPELQHRALFSTPSPSLVASVNSSSTSSASSSEAPTTSVAVSSGSLVASSSSSIEEVGQTNDSPTMLITMVPSSDAEEEVVVSPSDSPYSPSYLSRNSSARSSGKSRRGSARSLNLAVLQESLELSCKDGDTASSNQFSLNLAEKKSSGFVRKASDQLAGLLKMHSLREREPRKLKYVRISSSVSELDAMLIRSDLEVPDFLTPRPPRPPSRSGHTPTTPTSPLARSLAVSPSESPVPAGENPEGFLVSRFHHTQIRNKKRKQSPRIQRSISTQQDTDGGVAGDPSCPGKFTRSTSESPTASRSLQFRMEGRSAESPIREVLQEYATPTSHATPTPQASTLPRSKKGKGKTINNAGHGTTPNSPIPIHTNSKSVGAKSPKILRIFHRRQSSLSLKVFTESLEASMDSDLSSSFSLDRDHTPPKKLHQFPAKDVAMELTLMDSELLRRIRPEELEGGAWTKKETKEAKAPNVLQMVRSFNQLALLVPTEVLTETTPHARAKVISSFIQISHRCYCLHNYNSLKAVLAGLQCTPIFRLTKTWKEVNSKRRKRFEQLCSLMSEAENWQLYRRKVEQHIASKTPFIPFLGMFLTQVVQNDSYQQIRQAASSPKAKDSNHLPHPPPHLTSDLPYANNNSNTHRIRRRSASLGNCTSTVAPQSTSSPTSTVAPQPLHAPPLASEDTTADTSSANRFSYVVKEDENDVVFLDDHPLSCSLEEQGEVCDDRNGSQTGSRHVSYPNHAHVVAPNHSSMSESSGKGPSMFPTGSLEETDYAFEGSYAPVDPLLRGVPMGAPLEGEGADNHLSDRGGATSEDDLDIDDISFAFKRRSLSFESLLDSFRDDNKFQHLFRDFTHLSSLQSLADSSDEDSDQETETDKEPSLMSSSLMENSFSDYVSDCSSLNCSYNTSELRPIMVPHDDPLPDDARLAKAHSLDDRTSHGAGEVKKIVSSEIPLKFHAGHSSEDVCSLPDIACLDTCAIATGDVPGMATEGGEGTLETFEDSRGILSRMKRSKSQDSSSRYVLRSKPTKSKGMQFLHKPKQATNSEPTPTLASAPTDVLIQFQIASMGCVMGVESRAELRTVVKQSDTNSEKDNYSISQERE